MDKQKQIEEMAKYCCNACEMGWDYDFGDCAEKGKDGYKNCRLAKETAEMLYNAGYRKIPEGAVVFIPTEEKYAILSQKEYQRCERIEKIIKLAKQIADKNKGVGV